MKRHVEALDGIRGIAALWVLLGHASLLTGFNVPLIKKADLAVDLFILLSGFLMAYLYEEGLPGMDWSRPASWLKFYVQRFFRIAPLYYPVLILALILGPMLGAERSMIAHFVPETATPLSRYTDHSIGNVLTHLSFAFGLTPGYAFETPLPDWSIGLEMTFYAAFPLIMLVFAALGPIGASIVFGAVCLGLRVMFPHLIDAFEMPTFLPMKLPIFLAGSLVAIGYKRGKLPVYGAVALALTVLPVEHLGGLLSVGLRLAVTAIFAAIIFFSRASPEKTLAPIKVLGSKPFRWLGDCSYGVYLIHLLILIPVVAIVDARIHSGALRWIISAGITAAVAYPIAYVSYRFWEGRWHRFGKRIQIGKAQAVRSCVKG